MELKKITVLGDIMTEPGLLAQTKTAVGYDYTPVFADLRPMFAEADYVIVNLETPLAGEEAGYTERIVSFNAPDELAVALKEAGVDFTVTANNHCVDRVCAGLNRTLEVLDRIGLAHTGTFASPDDPRVAYFTVGDTRVAVIAATCSVNDDVHGYLPPAWQVNMLRPFHPSTHVTFDPHFYATVRYVEELCGRKLLWEEGIKLKRTMGLPVWHSEAPLVESEIDAQMALLEKDVAEAKQNADLVIFCPHSGGQFNVEPGPISTYIAKKAAEMGFDAVFAAHSHTTQRAAFLGEMPCFYCLGNVTMSANTVYAEHSCLPDYGIAAHLYVGGGKIRKTAFSIYKIVEKEGEIMRVVPVDALEKELTEAEKPQFLADVLEVYNRVTGKREFSVPIQSEYGL